MKSKDLVKALRLAATIVENLVALGVRVNGARWDGERTVIVVDAEPAFMTGALIRREPEQDAVVSVYASLYHGCQVQWQVRNPIVQGVPRHAH